MAKQTEGLVNKANAIIIGKDNEIENLKLLIAKREDHFKEFLAKSEIMLNANTISNEVGYKIKVDKWKIKYEKCKTYCIVLAYVVVILLITMLNFI